MLSLLLYLHLTSSTAAIPPLADTRVEGNPHLEPSGVGRSSNHHSTLRTNPTGVSPATTANPVRKRAFARAQQRARIHGATRYKGRWMSAAELGVEPTPTPAKPHASPRKPAARFQYLSWNAGGLHVSRYQELKHWLQQPAASQLDLIAIQETHWQGAQEYATARHYAIHSGGSKSEAGLLVLINKHTFPESKIQHRDLIPGRLLHLRLESDPCIEVFIGYQHAWSLGARANQPKHKETLLEKRSEFWTQLAKALHAVPKRNQVLVLADMNTDLHTDSIHVGKGVYVRQAQHASDANFLQELLRQQQLVALNTWRKAGPTSCTFLSASTGTQGSSQIDFALARHAHSDSLARQAKPMDLPFVPTQGLRHRPILGTIPYPRPPHGKPQKPVLTMKRVRDACLRLPALLPTFSMQVSHVHADHPHLDTATLLATALHRALAHQPQQETTPAYPDPQPLAIPLESLWALRKKVRGVTLRSLTTALGVWRHWRNVMLLNRKQREVHKQCRRLKQERLARLLADTAGSNAGLTGVFQLLRGLAPKAPRRKLQLRAQDGMPLSSAGTLAAIQTYYTHLFNQCPAPALGPPPATPLHITLSELKLALAKLPAHKALPSRDAPAILWRAAAADLATKCLPALNTWLCDMRGPPPENLNVAEICLIPKPSKPLIGPEALRPISLLPPLAKALASILNTRIQTQLLRTLGRLPQYAYTANRCVADAVDRAFTHCHAVRKLLRTQQQTIHLRREGHYGEGCKGGLTLSLDLQKAFDVLPRSKLHEALVHAGLDPSITWTIMNIHESARMQFKHGEHQVSIGTTNGVRQGCGLAPSLWTLFTCLILEKLALRIPLQCITAYADDLLIQWIITSQEQLHTVRSTIGYVFEVLQDFGMKISVEKTIVLLGLRGQQARTVLQHMTTRDPRKGRLFRIPASSGEIRLPIVRQHTYLGVQLSYERFEHQTLLDRIKHCWTAFNRLLPAFRSKGLTNAQKLRIWKACPFASLFHGLDCAQLDNADQARLRKHVVRQLRILDKAPSFITRESAGDLLHRLAIPEPLQTLQNRTLDRVTKCLEEPKASLLEPATRRRLQQLQSFTQACQEASQRSANGATPRLHPAAEKRTTG